MRAIIISGFLGSGKTTLLRRLLREADGRSLGVIVNDLAELEVDGDLMRAAHRVSEKEGTLISVHSGSISGGQRGALASALDQMKQTGVKEVVIETSGSTHPWPLIEEVCQHSDCQLATFVTLVDARAFVEDFGSGQELFRQLIHNQDHDQRTTANLLAEQIQFASLILLTKTDRLSQEDLPLVHKCLEILNPEAEVHKVVRGKLEPALLLDQDSFSLQRALTLAEPWLDDTALQPGEPTDYDIGSTVISDPRPLHPDRLWRLFRTRLTTGIHRSKGFIWLASRDDQVLLWNQAAGGIDLELLAYWRAAVVKDPLGKLLSEEKAVLATQLKEAHPRYGDRLNELTIIGALEERARFVKELEQCFCSESEILHWESGGHFEDPWPTNLRQVD